MKHFRTSLLLVALSPTFALVAHAEENPWGQAFPPSERESLDVQAGIGGSEAAVGAMALKASSTIAGETHNFEEAVRQAASDRLIAKHPELTATIRDVGFLERKRRVAKLQAERAYLADIDLLGKKAADEIASMPLSPPRELSPAQRSVKDMLRAEVQQVHADLKAGRAVPVEVVQHATTLAKLKILQGLKVLGGAGLIADGSLRLGLAISGRDPGYSPAIILGHTTSKAVQKAFKPDSAEGAGGATLSAE